MADEISSGGIGEFIAEHPAIAVGGVVVVLFAGYMLLNKGKTASQPSANTAQGQATMTDLTGLSTDAQGNHVVYVPTTTTFTTNNRITGSNVNSPNSTTATSSVNAPSATSVTSTPSTTVNAPTTTTVTVSNTVPPTPVPVPTPAPPPPSTTPSSNTPGRTGTPAPTPQHKGGLVWDQHYTIRGGDTLSGIAANLTNSLRRAGMPTSLSVTYNDIYAHNTVTINKYAQQHGTPIKNPAFPTPAAINNIFPGEIIVVPRWDKNIN